MYIAICIHYQKNYIEEGNIWPDPEQLAKLVAILNDGPEIETPKEEFSIALIVEE